jgi:hypothetical protein
MCYQPRHARVQLKRARLTVPIIFTKFLSWMIQSPPPSTKDPFRITYQNKAYFMTPNPKATNVYENKRRDLIFITLGDFRGLNIGSILIARH